MGAAVPRVRAPGQPGVALRRSQTPPPGVGKEATAAADEKSGAVVTGTGENYGEGWNNYGHDVASTRPAKAGNGAFLRAGLIQAPPRSGRRGSGLSSSRPYRKWSI